MNPFSSGDDPHHVQYLLSLLRDDNQDERSSGQRGTIPDPPAPARQEPVKQAAQPRPDLKYLSASQALPHLRTLCKDARLLRELMRLKRQQDDLERSLAKAQRFAEAEADVQPEQREAKLEAWKAQCLERWDDMARHQQSRLQEMSLPGFYPTTSPAARANQREILDLLSELIDSDSVDDVNARTTK